MSIVTYTVRSTYPRISVTQADKSVITARKNLQNSWKGFWDGVFTSAANTYLTASNSSLMDGDDAWRELQVLGLYGWIMNSPSYHDKMIEAAVWLADNPSNYHGWITRRFELMGMCIAYNYGRSGLTTFTEADRKKIGDSIVAYANSSTSEEEFLDGWSGGNMMAHLWCGITLYGESGAGYNYTSAATTLIDQALGFWFGDTAGDDSHLETYRYFANAGALWSGVTYTSIELWKAFNVLDAMRTGFVQNSETASSLQLNGVDYNPVVDEDWIQKIGEWLLWAWYRGDQDNWRIDDTSSQTAPWVSYYMRPSISWLITYGGTWRKPLHWMLYQLNGAEAANGSYSARNIVYDVINYDPADPDNARVPPTTHTPAIPKTRFFLPPGDFWHRNNWDYSSSVAINIQCQEHYYRGHCHLDCGAIQIGVNDDMVLTGSGLYSTSDQYADYGGLHHRYWYQQSISKSGIPRVDDGSTTHENTNRSGQYITLPSGDGGQLFKTWTDGALKRDCYNVNDMRFDGGGEAWLRCIPTMPVNTDNHTFLHLDIRRAYALDYQDLDTDAERVRRCHVKYLVIKEESPHPIILKVVHLQARLASMDKYLSYHTYGGWTLTYPHPDGQGLGPTQRAEGTGYAGTGKVLVDHYNWPDHSTQALGGTPDSNGYLTWQFRYGGTQYAPDRGAHFREVRDIGRWRLQYRAAIQRTEEYFVFLFFPLPINESPPGYTWINEANWYGVRFGGSGHEYRIHKTLAQVATTSDTTPPGQPGPLTATVGNQQIGLSWPPNVETDIASYKSWYREKV